MPSPLYPGDNVHPAYEIRYAWTGWPLQGGDPFPEKPAPNVFAQLDPLWETDGLRLLEHRWSGESLQLTLSAKPNVGPVFCAARVKGRLQHALRGDGWEGKFSRKVSLRSVGHNARRHVERYIRRQVANEEFADPRFAKRLESHHRRSPEVDLSAPSVTTSGRYWYDLHLVLVTAGRYRFGDDKSLATISEGAMAIAAKKGHRISELSVMPDHLHLALRANVEHSPHEIALGFQNNLAYRLGQFRVWEETYYIGTFGEYDMGAVRRGVDL